MYSPHNRRYSIDGLGEDEMSEKPIRRNPPSSVRTFEEHEKYKVLYDDITDNDVILQYHDRHALAELAVTMCEMDRLRADLIDNGEWQEVQGDRNKIKKKNPARDALEKIRPAVLRLMKEFKMTPSSRGKTTIGLESGAKTEDGFDEV